MSLESLVKVAFIPCCAAVECTVLLACSGSSFQAAPEAPGSDAAADANPSATAGSGPAANYPAFSPRQPQVVSLGGKVLASPTIVPISFDGDPLRADIEAFTASIGTSSYWAAAVAEYGVGPARSAAPIHLPASAAPPAIADRAVESWLAGMLDGTHPDWPAPDGNTMYAIFYPAGTTYTLAGYPPGYCLYGNDTFMTLADGRRVPYIVMPRCPDWPGMNATGSLAWTMSHEYVEEATDPFKTAYETVDATDMGWSWDPSFAEIGDMCDYPFEVTNVADFAYPVQRVWSDAAAAAGGDPCVPAPAGETYFNSVPVESDDVAIGTSWWSGTTTGILVPVGESRTVEVDLFSSGPTPGPWQVAAFDWGSYSGVCGNQGCPAPELSLSLDRTEGQNGDRLDLTITALRKGQGGGSRFLVVSTLGTMTTYWVGYVGN